jgi:hypothetical protein
MHEQASVGIPALHVLDTQLALGPAPTVSAMQIVPLVQAIVAH